MSSHSGVLGSALADSKRFFLSSSSPLGPGDIVASENGTLFLTMQLDGNVVLYEGSLRRGRRLWQTSTKGFRQNLMLLETDCSLSVHNGLQLALGVFGGKSVKPLWNSNWSATGTTFTTALPGNSSQGIVKVPAGELAEPTAINGVNAKVSNDGECYGVIDESDKSFILLRRQTNGTNNTEDFSPVWSTRLGKLNDRQRFFGRLKKWVKKNVGLSEILSVASLVAMYVSG